MPTPEFTLNFCVSGFQTTRSGTPPVTLLIKRAILSKIPAKTRPPKHFTRPCGKKWPSSQECQLNRLKKSISQEKQEIWNELQHQPTHGQVHERVPSWCQSKLCPDGASTLQKEFRTTPKKVAKSNLWKLILQLVYARRCLHLDHNSATNKSKYLIGGITNHFEAIGNSVLSAVVEGVSCYVKWMSLVFVVEDIVNVFHKQNLPHEQGKETAKSRPLSVNTWHKNNSAAVIS